MKKPAAAFCVATLLGLGLAFFAAQLPDWQREARQSREHGRTIHETCSDYAHIRVRELGDRRGLFFVEADGSELLQSRIDLAAPERLELRYARAMFVSFLFRESQPRVLIVGLGGGGMVRFLNATMPETQVDAVEIDPAVVAIAADYFDTRSGPRTAIHTADAFVFLRQPDAPRYDAIYMDAFLRPPVDQDGTLREKAQRLKTTAFLRDVRARLEGPDGVAVFNLIDWEPTTPGDLAAIGEVFPQVYRFGVAGTGNLVVVASSAADRLGADELRKRAASLEAEAEWARSIGMGKIVEGLVE